MTFAENAVLLANLAVIGVFDLDQKQTSGVKICDNSDLPLARCGAKARLQRVFQQIGKQYGWAAYNLRARTVNSPYSMAACVLSATKPSAAGTVILPCSWYDFVFSKPTAYFILPASIFRRFSSAMNSYGIRWRAVFSIAQSSCFNSVLICLHGSLRAPCIMVLSKIEDALIFVWR